MNTTESHADSHWTPSSLAKGTPTVMVVDDDPAVLMIGKAILSTLPYNIIGASSGEDAMAKITAMIAEGRRPDLIILDLTMPGGMSGLDTLQEIRNVDPKVGVIACSGFFEQSAHDLCVALGFIECIEKPYTSESLTAMVRKCMTKLTEPAEDEQEQAKSPAEPALGPLVRSMASSSARVVAEASS